jgi:hypothetical protein
MHLFFFLYYVPSTDDVVSTGGGIRVRSYPCARNGTEPVSNPVYNRVSVLFLEATMML